MVPRKQPKPPTVRPFDHSYLPSKSDLEEDLLVDATFEELAKAVPRTLMVEFLQPLKRCR